MKESKTQLNIGITDCDKFDNYANWFALEQDVHILKLSPRENNLQDVEKCHGIILSGGEDVHPKYYGRPEWMHQSELKLEVNELRDEFEMKIIDKAYKQRIPLLGICRGLQIANVYFKGTLIPDINPESFKKHTRVSDTDKIHSIQVEKNSCLQGIVLNNSGKVNSAHHQAADKIGEGLRTAAKAEDGTIESLEWKDSSDKPFLLLVQWHPERMEEQESAFSKNIKDSFLKSMRSNVTLIKS